MSKSNDNLVMPSWLRTWEQFWFTPGDPTLLGLMRFCCGMIAVYTLFAYSFDFQDMMGEYAWNDIEARMDMVRERAVTAGPMSWSYMGVLERPKNQFEEDYLFAYQREFNIMPPPPYPLDEDEAKMLNDFKRAFGIDLRMNGLRPPRGEKKEWELKYAQVYTLRHMAPPPAYPKDDAEMAQIEDYFAKQGADPRRVYAKGSCVFSLWFHVLDPDTMWVLHLIIIGVTFLFTIGFATRITSALAWFGSIGYIQRNPHMVFGVDTMMMIMLLYLMIGPSGAAFSVDNVIRRWWVKAKPGIVQAWFRLWRRPVPSLAEIAPADPVVITPSVSANLAIRLLQIHVGIIYLVAGLAKLFGNAWWTGEALWGTLGNFEFAPMQFGLYRDFLAYIGQYQWLYALIMTGGGLFTLTFEIGYMFLIWRPKLRWVFLAGAILLHGFIGLFMGLKTFSMMMLVMNMAFLKKEEVYYVIRKLGLGAPATATPPTTSPTSATQPTLQPAVAATALKSGS